VIDCDASICSKKRFDLLAIRKGPIRITMDEYDRIPTSLIYVMHLPRFNSEVLGRKGILGAINPCGILLGFAHVKTLFLPTLGFNVL
jgi:hypothetical protein